MNISGLSYSPSSFTPPSATRNGEPAAAGKASKTDDNTAQTGQLSAAEVAQLSKLKARDQVVRRHEQAHLSAAGGLANSGASFTYQRGPDGVNYAVGGEVSIDTSGGNTPEETRRRAETIRAAALAPADPSGQDLAVAAQAAQMAAQATAEMAKQRQEESNASGEDERTAERGSTIERFYGVSQSADGGGFLSVYA